MLIRNQNKEAIVNINNGIVYAAKRCDGNSCSILFKSDESNEVCMLGDYTDQSEAMKVMDNMLLAYEVNQKVFKMPEAVL